MNLSTNLSTLDNNLKAINEAFDFINDGGCASVAAMLATALRHTFPIMRITSCNRWSSTIEDLDDVRSNMEDNLNKDEWFENTKVGFSHVWVEIFAEDEWYAIDSTGVHTRDAMYYKWYKPAKGSFSIDEIQALSEGGGWNHMFDRDQLPAMQDMINETIH